MAKLLFDRIFASAKINVAENIDAISVFLLFCFVSQCLADVSREPFSSFIE